jgi:hypothetical protein
MRHKSRFAMIRLSVSGYTIQFKWQAFWKLQLRVGKFGYHRLEWSVILPDMLEVSARAILNRIVCCKDSL